MSSTYVVFPLTLTNARIHYDPQIIKSSMHNALRSIETVEASPRSKLDFTYPDKLPFLMTQTCQVNPTVY